MRRSRSLPAPDQGISSLFRFVQFDFPGALGPPDGRHTLRDHADKPPTWIVGVQTLGPPGGPAGGEPPAGRRRRPWRGRPRRVEPDRPARLTVSRVTVIDPRPLAGEAHASAWLDHLDLAAEARSALGVVNRLIAAQRIAAADPYAHELPETAAAAVRAGFGAGEEVADGRWTRAVAPPDGPGPGRGRRSRPAGLRPQQRLSALLAGRDRPLACEELALRARLDLDLGRPLAAALGTRLALEAVLVELGASARTDGLQERLDELRRSHDDVIAAANSAVVGPLAEAHRETVARTLERIEATLRVRAAGY